MCIISIVIRDRVYKVTKRLKGYTILTLVLGATRFFIFETQTSWLSKCINTKSVCYPTKLCSKDEQWIVFSKYVLFTCLLIQIHRLRKILKLVKYFEWFASFINICCLSYCCFYKKYKKRRKKKTNPASKANTQPSTEYYSVRMQIIIILCLVYMTFHGESKATTSCVLSSVSRISISNFEYEWCEYNIKISMNAYKYQKLYSMTRIFYLNTYCWSLISFSF